MDELSDLLHNLEIFRALSAEELRAVAAACAWRSLRDGEAVFTAGPRGGGSHGGAGTLFVVREGEVLITRSGPEGREIALATFVAGESFGELGLFGADSGATSARCEGDVRLLEFPARELKPGSPRSPLSAAVFFDRHPAIAAKVLNALLGVMARRIRSTNRLIAEKRPWVQELRRQVLLDKLTGLHNATWLEEEFAATFASGGKPAGASLLMIKPDNFKLVNDTCGGHQAGDRVLQLMAGDLRSLLGERGVPIRYRGDVLAAALPGMPLSQARELAQRVRRSLHALDLSEVGPIRITVSVGVASCPRGCSPGAAAELAQRAYANLFAARNAGGDRVRSVFRSARGPGA